MPSDFSPNNVWGSSTPDNEEPQELTLGSGQTCRAKKVSMEELINLGILTDADSLTALVERHTRKVKGGKGADGVTVNEMSLLSDAETMTAIVSLADKAMPVVVVSPEVVHHFIMTTVGKTTVTKTLTDEERDEIRSVRPGVIFTDQISLPDKMELFAFGVGGLNSLVPFRDEPTTHVGNVGSRGGNKKGTKRGPRVN